MIRNRKVLGSMEPGEVLRAMGIHSELVHKVISKRPRTAYNGLCLTFQRADSNNPGHWYHFRDWYDQLPKVLGRLGGRAYADYFWRLDDQGEQERAMMLAFMLTWLENP